MGWVAIGAGLTFGLAMVMLTLFFRRQDVRFDRVAEWSFVAFSVLAGLTIRVVADGMADAGPELLGIAITVVGLAGVVVLGLGELASTLHLVDFRRIAGLITVAFLGFLVWIGGVSLIVALSKTSPLPAALGWLGLASIVVGIAIIGWMMRTPGMMTGAVDPSPAALTAFFVPLAGIVAWMVWLGTVLA